MPFPNQNRRNSRMRSNTPPPPSRSPYLSYTELQKKAYNYQQEQVQKAFGQPNLNQPDPLSNPISSIKKEPEPVLTPDVSTASYPMIKDPRDMMTMNDEDDYGRDVSYMIRIYPESVRRILGVIQDEIDKIDYSGSYIYDKYPDRTTLFELSRIIFEIVLPMTISTAEESKIPQDPSLNPPDILPPANSPTWLLNLITTLVFNEVLERRRQKYI